MLNAWHSFLATLTFNILQVRDPIPEEEMKRRQEEQMRQFYQNIEQRKEEQLREDRLARMHHDTLL